MITTNNNTRNPRHSLKHVMIGASLLLLTASSLASAGAEDERQRRGRTTVQRPIHEVIEAASQGTRDARREVTRAAYQGNCDAQYFLGQHHENQGNYTVSITYYQSAARQGHRESQEYLRRVEEGGPRIDLLRLPPLVPLAVPIDSAHPTVARGVAERAAAAERERIAEAERAAETERRRVSAEAAERERIAVEAAERQRFDQAVRTAADATEHAQAERAAIKVAEAVRHADEEKITIETVRQFSTCETPFIDQVRTLKTLAQSAERLFSGSALDKLQAVKELFGEHPTFWNVLDVRPNGHWTYGSIKGLWTTKSLPNKIYSETEDKLAALMNRLNRFRHNEDKTLLVNFHVELIKGITLALLKLKKNGTTYRAIVSDKTRKNNVRLFADYLHSFSGLKDQENYAEDSHCIRLCAAPRIELFNKKVQGKFAAFSLWFESERERNKSDKLLEYFGLPRHE